MKRLLILSGKGGTGKTTTAAAFIRFSGAKAVADCDVDAPNLHLVIGSSKDSENSDFFGGDKAQIDAEKCIGCGLCLEKCRFGAIEKVDAHFSVNEFACEGCGVCAHVCPASAVSLHTDIAGEKILYRGENVFSTAMLKMGRGNSGKLVTEVKLSLLKNAPETPLAIFDGSPGIGCQVIASVSGMDLVLAVAEPTLSGISDLKRLIATAKAFGAKLSVCVNKWDVSYENTNAIKAFCEAEGVPFVGKIPYDRHVPEAVNAGASIADIDCAARDALKEIYEAVMKLLEL